ncbi:MAG: hypothetical protein FWF43_05835 [Propionibacteriaceae bacterium]|nr:hypothetical protein [Propionibacteriaceae bacterium]
MKAQTQTDSFPREHVHRWLTARLDEVRESGRGQLLSVRGRRQAGKSTAVERFVETSGVPYVYVTGLYRMTEAAQLEVAGEAFADSRMPLPIDLPEAPASWREWLSRLALAASDTPIIAVLDEFPWMTGGDTAGLEGVLQMVWDRVLEKLPVLLILIGSDLAMMERLAQHDRPLFGRVRELVVPALNPAEVSAALPGASPMEVFDAYIVTGGYPRLVSDLKRRGTPVKDWVRECFTDDLSPLVATGRLILEAEFTDSAAAYRVLAAVGASEPAQIGLKDISGAIASTGGVNKTVETAAQRALATLVDGKRLVVRELPAWAASNRLRRYRITDPYLRFWFPYVERYVDVIARGRGDLAHAAFERDWSSWRGHAVEPIVRNALELLGATDERLAGVESVLPWWTRDGQVEVDVVASSRETTEFLGTIKWREKTGINERDIAALEQVRTRVPRSADAKLAAISPEGTAPATADVAFSATDLLTAWAPSLMPLSW